MISIWSHRQVRTGADSPQTPVCARHQTEADNGLIKRSFFTSAPLVADVDVAGFLVEEAVLGFLDARGGVVGLLLAFRLGTNPWHGFWSA